MDQELYYRGVRTLPYDLVKELAIALGVVLLGILALSAVLSSPDEPPLTIQKWAQAQPADFVTTATAELAGQTTSSGYGPPYTTGSGAVQTWGPFAPQIWFGTRQPVNPAQDFVLRPLGYASAGNPGLTSALRTYNSAGGDTQQTWLSAYAKALGRAEVVNGVVTVPTGHYGPLTTMMSSLLTVARTGGLDGLLVRSGRFYQTDYTKPLLFMGDGGYLPALAQQQHLMGDQWGMMNETGSYPGQTWLWLFTMWYQLPPFNSASDADLLVVLMMLGLTTLLALVPFIPGFRDIPRLVPIYRLIWRDHYREQDLARRTAQSSNRSAAN
ncbi:MAG: hypothetical protein ACREPI_03470 [Candidatus Dormibacterales bacterium]